MLILFALIVVYFFVLSHPPNMQSVFPNLCELMKFCCVKMIKNIFVVFVEQEIEHF